MSSQFEDSNSWVPQIGDPCDGRIFSLAEAQSLLPVVRKVTRRAAGDFDPVRRRYRNLLDCDPRKPQLALQYEKIIRRWMTKMARFGLAARGLWSVDFDTGDGYLSWKFPELRLAFFVDSSDPNLIRQELSEVLAEPSEAVAVHLISSSRAVLLRSRKYSSPSAGKTSLWYQDTAIEVG